MIALDAINKIILNGCQNLECINCPLADSNGAVIRLYKNLCEAIDEL